MITIDRQMNDITTRRAAEVLLWIVMWGWREGVVFLKEINDIFCIIIIIIIITITITVLVLSLVLLVIVVL